MSIGSVNFQLRRQFRHGIRTANLREVVRKRVLVTGRAAVRVAEDPLTPFSACGSRESSAATCGYSGYDGVCERPSPRQPARHSS